MNRNFSDIKTNVGNNIQDTSSSTATVIGVYVNDIHADLIRRLRGDGFIREYSFSTTVGTKDYVLPRNFEQEIYVFDSTNKINLERITLQEQVQAYGSTFGENGSAERYMILDFPGDTVITSTTITVASSSASDSTQTIRITGLANGVETSEDLTLNGTSDVTTTTTFTSITSISKSAVTVGYVTVTDSSANTIAILSVKDKDYRGKVLRLNDTPDEVKTVNVAYRLKIEPMSDDLDVPLIDAADVIELGATAKAWRYKRQFGKAADYEVLYEKAMERLTYNEENQHNLNHRFAYTPYERET